MKENVGNTVHNLLYEFGHIVRLNLILCDILLKNHICEVNSVLEIIQKDV